MFTVCIDAQDDGQFRVYVEQPDAEDAMEAPEGPEAAAPMGQPPEMPEADPEESGGQVFPSIKEALTAVLDALKNEGKMADTSEEDEAFQSAFKGVK